MDESVNSYSDDNQACTNIRSTFATTPKKKTGAVFMIFFAVKMILREKKSDNGARLYK